MGLFKNIIAEANSGHCESHESHYAVSAKGTYVAKDFIVDVDVDDGQVVSNLAVTHLTEKNNHESRNQESDFLDEKPNMEESLGSNTIDVSRKDPENSQMNPIFLVDDSISLQADRVDEFRDKKENEKVIDNNYSDALLQTENNHLVDLPSGNKFDLSDDDNKSMHTVPDSSEKEKSIIISEHIHENFVKTDSPKVGNKSIHTKSDDLGKEKSTLFFENQSEVVVTGKPGKTVKSGAIESLDPNVINNPNVVNKELPGPDKGLLLNNPEKYLNENSSRQFIHKDKQIESKFKKSDEGEKVDIENKDKIPARQKYDLQNRELIQDHNKFNIVDSFGKAQNQRYGIDAMPDQQIENKKPTAEIRQDTRAMHQEFGKQQVKINKTESDLNNAHLHHEIEQQSENKSKFITDARKRDDRYYSNVSDTSSNKRNYSSQSQAKETSEPKVVIGQVNVTVEIPASKTIAPRVNSSPNAFASRNYLRKLR